jgi:hypothetical protein
MSRRSATPALPGTAFTRPQTMTCLRLTLVCAVMAAVRPAGLRAKARPQPRARASGGAGRTPLLSRRPTRRALRRWVPPPRRCRRPSRVRSARRSPSVRSRRAPFTRRPSTLPRRSRARSPRGPRRSAAAASAAGARWRAGRAVSRRLWMCGGTRQRRAALAPLLGRVRAHAIRCVGCRIYAGLTDRRQVATRCTTPRRPRCASRTRARRTTPRRRPMRCARPHGAACVCATGPPAPACAQLLAAHRRPLIILSF